MKPAAPPYRRRFTLTGRHPIGHMNKTEAAYAVELERRKHAGEVAWWKHEGIKLRLADLTFYTPDFVVMLASTELQLHEVKGFWQDDAKVKIKVAADQFPFVFVVVKAEAKKRGGGFVYEEVAA